MKKQKQIEETGKDFIVIINCKDLPCMSLKELENATSYAWELAHEKTNQ